MEPLQNELILEVGWADGGFRPLRAYCDIEDKQTDRQTWESVWASYFHKLYICVCVCQVYNKYVQQKQIFQKQICFHRQFLKNFQISCFRNIVILSSPF